MKKAVFVDLLNLFWDQHGIYSMTSVMRQSNIDVHFVGTRSLKKALTKITEIEPDILLYSAFDATIPRFVEFDRLVKENMSIKSLIGGPGPTYDWKCIEQSTIDAICVGEGEVAIVDFINNGFMSCKNIFRRGDNFPSEFNPLVGLDSLPFPDRSVVYECDSLLRDMSSKQFLSGRGCPYRCTYCFNHKFNQLFKECGSFVRKKSVDYLLEEIRLVKRDYPLKTAVFQDDTFIINKRWFMEFCERFPKEIGLTYTCNVRPNLVDEEIVEALQRSNCCYVNWSIESGDEFLRNEILKRGISNAQILETAEILTKYGIQYRIGNIIGIPGEEFDQMLETVGLNIKAKPHLALANIFVPFPGLELTKYAIESGYYDEKPKNEMPKDFFTETVLNVSKKEKKKTYKLMCLFPIFVSVPNLFYDSGWRKALFLVPKFILRAVYEIIYTSKLSRMYVMETSLKQKIRMAVRYLRNL
jgi:radical SAM superfamily enzyme YgiQ (UPF0313 family)